MVVRSVTNFNLARYGYQMVLAHMPYRLKNQKITYVFFDIEWYFPP